MADLFSQAFSQAMWVLVLWVRVKIKGPGIGPQVLVHVSIYPGQPILGTYGCGSKLNSKSLRRFWSIFPLPRATHFGTVFFLSHRFIFDHHRLVAVGKLRTGCPKRSRHSGQVVVLEGGQVATRRSLVSVSMVCLVVDTFVFWVNYDDLARPNVPQAGEII